MPQMFPSRPGRRGSVKLKQLLVSPCSPLAMSSSKPAPSDVDPEVDTVLRELWSAAEARPMPRPILDLIDRLEALGASPAPEETRSFDED